MYSVGVLARARLRGFSGISFQPMRHAPTAGINFADLAMNSRVPMHQKSPGPPSPERDQSHSVMAISHLARSSVASDVLASLDSSRSGSQLARLGMVPLGIVGIFERPPQLRRSGYVP